MLDIALRNPFLHYYFILGRNLEGNGYQAIPSTFGVLQHVTHRSTAVGEQEIGAALPNCVGTTYLSLKCATTTSASWGGTGTTSTSNSADGE